MSRVEIDHSFPGGGPRVAEAVRALDERHGLTGDEAPGDGGACELTGGSQLRMRLLGGWFVKPRVLPKRATVSRSGDGVHVRVEETMGVGVLDPKLRRKYEEEFEAIARTLAETLGR